MLLYTTVSSERGKTVSKSGNEWIQVDLNIASNEPNYSITANLNEVDRTIDIFFQSKHFGKWTDLYRGQVFTNKK